MRRPLIFLAIFTTFFAISWVSLAYLTTPAGDKGHTNTTNVSLFFVLFFGFVTTTITLIVALFKTFRPNRKLPPLLIKDSLYHGLVGGIWLTGLLMLQLLRSATWINLILWLIILLATEWTVIGSQKLKNKNQIDHSQFRR
jgi:hypothetical protein